MSEKEWEPINKNLFQWNGRVGREFFFIVAFVSFLLFVGSVFLVGLWIEEPSMIFLCFPIYIGCGLVVVTNSIKRLHDIKKSGFIALLLMVPAISFFLIVYLMLTPSKWDNP